MLSPVPVHSSSSVETTQPLERSVKFAELLTQTAVIPRDTLSEIARTNWLGSVSKQTLEFDTYRYFVSYGVYGDEEYIIVVSDTDPDYALNRHFRETTVLSDSYPAYVSVADLKISSSADISRDVLLVAEEIAPNVFIEFVTGMRRQSEEEVQLKEELVYASMVAKLQACDASTGQKKTLWSTTPVMRFITHKMLLKTKRLYRATDDLLPPSEVYLIKPSQLEPGVNYTYAELLMLAKTLYIEKSGGENSADASASSASALDSNGTGESTIRQKSKYLENRHDSDTVLAPEVGESSPKRRLLSPTQSVAAPSARACDLACLPELLDVITPIVEAVVATPFFSSTAFSSVTPDSSSSSHSFSALL